MKRIIGVTLIKKMHFASAVLFLLVIFIMITSEFAIAQVKEEWVAWYHAMDSVDNVPATLLVDAAGDVYVTGTSYLGGSAEYSTIKYDTSGQKLWMAQYNPPDSYWNVATALAVDDSGNVYVTGHSYGLDTNSDYSTIKYDPSGNELWVARYNGPGNATDQAAAIAVDAAGNVFVTGDSSSDYATIKYDPSGNELWVARYNGPGNATDQAKAIAVDAAGNVYVTGESASNTSSDYATIKLVPNNLVLNNSESGGGGGGRCFISAIAN
jgi:hypothetical protein